MATTREKGRVRLGSQGDEERVDVGGVEHEWRQGLERSFVEKGKGEGEGRRVLIDEGKQMAEEKSLAKGK